MWGASGACAGGIIGYNSGGEISNCSNTGAITANNNQAGGIAGWQKGGTIKRVYNEGKVESENSKLNKTLKRS